MAKVVQVRRYVRGRSIALGATISLRPVTRLNAIGAQHQNTHSKFETKSKRKKKKKKKIISIRWERVWRVGDRWQSSNKWKKKDRKKKYSKQWPKEKHQTTEKWMGERGRTVEKQEKVKCRIIKKVCFLSHSRSLSALMKFCVLAMRCRQSNCVVAFAFGDFRFQYNWSANCHHDATAICRKKKTSDNNEDGVDDADGTRLRSNAWAQTMAKTFSSFWTFWTAVKYQYCGN